MQDQSFESREIKHMKRSSSSLYIREALLDHSVNFLHPASCILYPAVSLLLTAFLLLLGFPMASRAGDLENAVAGLERRYASVTTMTGDFRQTYRAPGIEQVESGAFWLKKPVRMRWEYRQPEEKLFVTDGREAFLYVPQDRQATVQDFRASDMRGMPLDLLLGTGGVLKSFAASWETEFRPKADRTFLIRLTPRDGEADYAFLVVELDRETYDIRRIVIREATGNTSEFLLTGVRTNIKVDKEKFRFKIPEGVEVIRRTGDR